MSRIVILGAGESGAGAAVLAKKEGFDVFVSDMSRIQDKYKKMLDDRNIEWEEGQHTEEKILNADEVIKSPGIPNEAPMIKKIIAKAALVLEHKDYYVTDKEEEASKDEEYVRVTEETWESFEKEIYINQSSRFPQ